MSDTAGCWMTSLRRPGPWACLRASTPSTHRRGSSSHCPWSARESSRGRNGSVCWERLASTTSWSNASRGPSHSTRQRGSWTRSSAPAPALCDGRGYDFRFGRARAGDLALIRTRLPELPIEQADAHEVGGIVSSSRIREVVEAGDMETAQALLGRPHRIHGTGFQGTSAVGPSGS